MPLRFLVLLPLLGCPPAPAPVHVPVPVPAPTPSEAPAQAPADRPPLPPPEAPAKPPVPGRPGLVLSVAYVNLGHGPGSAARIFDVDEDGGTLYRYDRHELEGIRGHLSKPSMDRLNKAGMSVCTVKKPDTEPMTFVRIEVTRGDARCSMHMTEQEWRRREPELMKTIKALEEEACKGPCKVPMHIDDMPLN